MAVVDDSAAVFLQEARAARRAGRLDEAASRYADLLAVDPEQPDALHFLGVLDYQSGRTEAGLARIEAAVRACPDVPEYLSNLGTVYLALGRIPDALRVYARAVELAPDVPAYGTNLAVALNKAGQHQEAMAMARKILAHSPGHAGALNVVGNTARLMGDFATARAAFAENLERVPDDPESHYNMGVVLQDLWDMAGAKACYDKAISLNPRMARYYVNHGAALMKLHQVKAAGESYARALELEPDLAEAHYNYAICKLLLGELSEGAGHYDWRLKVDETSLSKPRPVDAPMWDGTPAPDKTILLHSEQGLGDMIQFVRLASAVALMVGRVVVEVQRPLVRLFQDSFPDLTIVAKGAETPPVDLQIPLMSLMHALRLELDDLPASRVPYLTAQPERVALWAGRLAGKPGRKIAISWQGNPKAKVDRGRSIPLAELAPLLALTDVRFISLQKNDGAEQLDRLPPALRGRIETLGDDFDAGPDGFLDTVAVMKNCDLVLTSDTSIAHIAGGLGCPTWLMLKKTPDWRWMLERPDSPWYPGMRLFRQREDGDWAQVIADVVAALSPDTGELNAALEAHRAGRLDEAEAAYRRILSVRPDEPVARHHLGVVALQRGQADVAETHIRQALTRRPDDADALANLALALKAQDRKEEAIDTCRRVLALAPRHEAACNNLANLLKSIGRLGEALAYYQQAVALAPQKPDLSHNLGVALIEAGALAQAEPVLRRAAENSPQNADYHFDLARCLLMKGNWAEGWKEYEWRRRMAEFGAASEPPAPRWQGEAAPVLTLLVHAEQGLGDAIQFARFIAPARARVGRVILVVPPRLKALLSGVPGVDAVFGYGEPLPDYQAQVPLLSLPMVLGIGEAGLATTSPYIRVPADRVARWKEWRARHAGTRLIGLNWQGNPRARADVGRSLRLSQLASLAGVSGVTFVALQKGEATDQMAALPPGFPLIAPDDPFDEGPDAFLDTAALMGELDLVITTDTSVAHLAGVLGRPCWVMLKQVPDWRWMLERTDSPWYPGMRLFRQSEAGSWDQVIDQVRAALQACAPAVAAPDLAAALAAHRAGDTATAAGIYRAILASDPANVVARHYLGVTCHQQGKPDEAEAHIRAALAARPDYAEAWGNLGLVLKVQGHVDEAARVFERSLMLDPSSADVHNNYGNLLNGIKRHEQALEHYQAAIRLQPNRADSYQNMGNAFGDMDRPDEAISSFKRALALRPDYVAAMNGLGKAYRMKEDTDSALAVFREAVAVDPANADAWSNLGVCHREQQRYTEALDCYDRAVNLRPDHAESYSNRAIALHYTARFAEAEAAYARSLQLKPDRADAHFGLAAVLLTQGKWEEGWKEYEWRRRMKDSGPVRAFPQPMWDGSAIPGRTLFLFVEQGLGDTLQFMRFLPLIRQKADRVILEIQPGLHRLLEQAAGSGVQLLRRGEPVPPFDFYAPLMSAPGLLGITPDNLPAPESYLVPEPALVANWRQRLPGEGLLRVGLNWQGNPKASVDKGRSVPLQRLEPLLQVPGVQFVSLQKNDGVEQLDRLPADLRARIHTLGDDFDGGKDAFIDTAAVMANLDLVITSDTAMAHLAGALGRPCWVMLKFMPDWRWLFGRDDCPWYPHTRLFRQKNEGDWAGVAVSVAAALRDRLAD